MTYLPYLRYLLRHKLYVLLECIRAGIAWRGIVHDLSKFSPDEFIPYAKHFYGVKRGSIQTGRNETGYYKPTNTGDAAFDRAWFLHQKRNRHHWQWWTHPEDETGFIILPIEEPYLTEMICDWVGAGKAQGRTSPKDDRYFAARMWYCQNGHKLQLQRDTRRAIERRLGIPKHWQAD